MSSTIQITAMIEDFREIRTRSGKPMGIFILGGLPAKCFDENVNTAARAAQAGQPVSLEGEFSNYKGQTEFAALKIIAPSSEAGTSTEKASDPQFSPAVIGTSPQDGMDIVKGIVHDIKSVPTHSGLKMVTFRVGEHKCKLFGKNAEAMERTAHSQEGRVKSFVGHWETNGRGKEFIPEDIYNHCAAQPVRALPTRSMPTSVSKDARSIVPGDDTRKTTHTSEATTPPPDSDSFEQMLRGAWGLPRLQLSEDMITIVDQQTPIDPDQKLSASADEELIQQRTQSQQAAPTGETSPRKPPEIEGVISKIQDLSDSSRTMTTFRIGEQIVVLHDKAAEFVARHASEYTGKCIAVAGKWEPDENGRRAFVPEYSLPAVEPGSDDEITTEEVQKGLKRALLDIVYVRNGRMPLSIDEELGAIQAA